MNFRMSKIIFLAVLSAASLRSAEDNEGEKMHVFSLGFTTVHSKAGKAALLDKDPDYFECARSKTPRGRLMIADLKMDAFDVLLPEKGFEPDNTVEVGDPKIVNGRSYECVARAEVEPEGSGKFVPLFFIAPILSGEKKDRDLCFYFKKTNTMEISRLEDEG